jgi:beta-lactam-binding protein with PASTA domain
MRKRSTVSVPNVVGMSIDRAQTVLRKRGLTATLADPDLPPIPELGKPNAVVTDQSPESGAMVPPGVAIKLWVDEGGGGGVREPRRPKPDPKSNRQQWDEVADEAVS